MVPTWLPLLALPSIVLLKAWRAMFFADAKAIFIP